MKRIVVGTLAAAMMFASAVPVLAAMREKAVTLSPMLGTQIYDGEQRLDAAVTVGARAGYAVTPAITVEALYDYGTKSDSGRYKLKDISTHRLGGEALYHFSPEQKLVPYLAAGLSQIFFSGDGVNTRGHGAFEYGGGVKYFVTDSIALRGDVRHLIYKFSSTNFNNLEIAVGVSYQFGSVASATKAAPTAAPVAGK